MPYISRMRKVTLRKCRQFAQFPNIQPNSGLKPKSVDSQPSILSLRRIPTFVFLS